MKLFLREPYGVRDRMIPLFRPPSAAYRSIVCAAFVATIALSGPAVSADEQRSSPLAQLGIEFHGFLDARGGLRTQTDPYERNTSMAETRLQLDLNKMTDSAIYELRFDLVYDEITDQTDLNLEVGAGPLDIRETNILISPSPIMDLKIGRQILTWGTGDLLFINDLFPKDWQSFFAGRDDEYLKAPSDALFVSLFPTLANIDIVYTPRFDADRYIRGNRLSYWNPMLGRLAGRDAVVEPMLPDDWFQDDEIALRMSRNVSGYELALYGYGGFWKNPVGYDATSMRALFPELNVYGAGIRGSVGRAVFAVEGGYFDSRDDRKGDNPLTPNSEARLLAGYERQLARDFTGGLQYYIENMLNYDCYRARLLSDQDAREEYRQVITLRLTKLALNQNLLLSFFVFYSPTDEDVYLRPQVKDKVNDALTLIAGGNLFSGKEQHTFFGQFEKNSNVYCGVRYSF